MPVVAVTRSPIDQSVTPSPIAVISPATSVPGVNGGGILIWYLPCTSSASTKFTPAARTATTTFPARGCGASTSSTTTLSGGPISRHTTRRMPGTLRFSSRSDSMAHLVTAKLGDEALEPEPVRPA